MLLFWESEIRAVVAVLLVLFSCWVFLRLLGYMATRELLDQIYEAERRGEISKGTSDELRKHL